MPAPSTAVAQKVREGLWICAAYRAYFAGIGAILPYVALYYRQRGLSGGEIGLLMAILPLAGALLAPLLGHAGVIAMYRAIGALTLVALALFVGGWQLTSGDEGRPPPGAEAAGLKTDGATDA